MRVSENRVLRRIFGPKTDKVTEEWRKLQNGELHHFYVSLNIIGVIKSRRMGWVEHVARMREGRKAYKVLVGSPEGKTALGTPKSR
jgi:hypothetical protein